MTPIRHTAFASWRARIKVGIIAIPSLPQVGFSAKASCQINDSNGDKNKSNPTLSTTEPERGFILLHLCMQTINISTCANMNMCKYQL